MDNNIQSQALDAFNRSMIAIDFHLGSYHPLHCKIYLIIAKFLTVGDLLITLNTILKVISKLFYLKI